MTENQCLAGIKEYEAFKTLRNRDVEILKQQIEEHNKKLDEPVQTKQFKGALLHNSARRCEEPEGRRSNPSFRYEIA